MGRRPRRTFRGLVGCSLALRPACSRDRQAVLYVEGFDGFVTSAAAPTATGWSEPVAGWELHPLKTYTFARRTTSPFTTPSPFTTRSGRCLPVLQVQPADVAELPGIVGHDIRPWTRAIAAI